MEVIVLEECGYNQAALGMSLSFKDRATPLDKWWTAERFDRMTKTLEANAGRGKGHDKFLRQMMVWLTIEAPRYWWSEFDTYKVGTVAQSESTMHTLSRRYMTIEDCVYTQFNKGLIEEQVALFNRCVDEGTVQEIKQMVPEAYKQRRIVSLNYAVLGCIISQRDKHRLPEWHTFISSIRSQVKYSELLP